MLKFCGPSEMKALSFLFNNCLGDGVFLNNWKKANAIPVHKKGNKQLVSNYCPVSLLPICSKIFEKLIFDCIYDFLDQNCLLRATNQASGLVIPVYTSSYLLQITFLLRLILTFP